MNRSIVFISLFILLGCAEQKRAQQEIKDTAPLQVRSDPTRSKPERALTPNETCKCSPGTYKKRAFEERIDFDKMRYWEDTLKKWSQAPLVSQVKSIGLHGFDTVPKQLAVFKNVAQVLMRDGDTEILNMFPNLKAVYFFETKKLTINPRHKWLKRIEYFEAIKSNTYGLTSFALMPNLRRIGLGGGMRPFPTDIEALTCLEVLEIGFAHLIDETGKPTNEGRIDLSEMDLSSLNCLQSFSIYSYACKNIFGIPQRIDSTRRFKLIIQHQQLTTEEKEKIQRHNRQKGD